MSLPNATIYGERVEYPFASHSEAFHQAGVIRARYEAHDELVQIVRDARAALVIERNALAEAHTGADGALDADGAEWVADFDALIARMDAALSSSTRSHAEKEGE